MLTTSFMVLCTMPIENYNFAEETNPYINEILCVVVDHCHLILFALRSTWIAKRLVKKTKSNAESQHCIVCNLSL